MLTQRTRSYIFFPAAALLAGGIASFLTRDYFSVYKTLNQPIFAPPAWLFPVVWTVLYLLMGIGAARIAASPDSLRRGKALNIFVAQLVFNFFWSLIFFNTGSYGLALLWLSVLWVQILVLIFRFRNVDRAAALLQIPYLLWVTFAWYLNFGVWRLNG